jgi:hypothetical protein|nr:MAG TPA: hypothetical protein [Caudoviricetes sp.]
MDRLTGIKKRLLATTPGDWGVVEQNDDGDWIVSGADGTYIAQTSYDGLSVTTRETCRCDAEFIAHAKEDIAFLLEKLEVYFEE